MGRLLRRLRYWFRQDDHEAALAEELEFHRALKQQELESDGLASEAARFASRREMGNLTRAREESRATWVWPGLDGAWQDLRLAVRGLIRTPSFTLPALAILIITMGMTTTVFALVDTIFFRPWPVPEADRLAILDARRPVTGGVLYNMGAAHFRHLREHMRTLDLAASIAGHRRVADEPQTEWASTRFVSGNYFRVLRLPLAAGRPIYESDDVRGTAGAAVISHGLAERRFGGAANSVGKVVRVDDEPFTIVGVLAQDAKEHRLAPGPAVWLPLVALTRLPQQLGELPPDAFLTNADGCCVDVVGRLAPGATRDAAGREAQTLSSQFAAAHGLTAAQISARSTAEMEDPFAPRQLNVAKLFGLAMALVLLLGCANVGNLVLARAFSRRGDVAVRLWLGATRARLVRHLLAESLILAIVSGVVSTAMVAYSIPVVWNRFLPGIGNPVTLDVWTALFVVGLALLVAAVAGMLPALRATRIGQGLRVIGRIPVRLRTGLLAVQIAGCVVLLVSAALLARGIQHASGDGLGLTLADTVAVRLGVPVNTLSSEEYRQATRTVLDRIEQAGLGPVGGTQFLPFGGYKLTRDVRLPGGPRQPGQMIGTQYVTPGFFEVLQIRLVAGRLFGRESRPDDVVVEESLAELLWPGLSPLGRVFVEHEPQGNPRDRRPVEKRVIGVVANARTQRVDRRFPTYYEQASGISMVLLPAAPNASARVEDIIRATIPGAVPEVRDLTASVREQLVPAIIGASAGAVIAVIALLLAAVGTLGVFRYVVTERLTEIGVRKALGATDRDIVTFVLGGVRTPLIGGFAVGLFGARALGALLGGSLYGISPRDPIAYAIVLGAMAVVIVLALVGPARRAVRIDPASMLRAE